MEDLKCSSGDVEQVHFQSVRQSFMHYQRHSTAVVERMQPSYGGLDVRYKEMLPDIDRHFAAMKRCIAANYDLLCGVAEVAPHDMFENQREVNGGVSPNITPSEGDMDRVRGCLRHFVRDWSADGERERESCYEPLLAELEATFPRKEAARGDVRVLIPGSGLGRLAYEVRQRGFCAQGNELSLYMLLASDFVLNRTTAPQQHRIYPFIHQTTNLLSRTDAIREVRIPDVCPTVAAEEQQGTPGDFSMVAGDFVEIYSEAEQRERWQAVVTSFFIDTGRNVFDYIATIYHILPIGGHWINIGPLLFHFSEVQGETSVELSKEELRQVVISFGFDIVREDVVESTYNSNPRSMLTVNYANYFFHAVKTGRVTSPADAEPSTRTSTTEKRDIPPEVLPSNTTRLASDGPGQP